MLSFVAEVYEILLPYQISLFDPTATYSFITLLMGRYLDGFYLGAHMINAVVNIFVYVHFTKHMGVF